MAIETATSIIVYICIGLISIVIIPFMLIWCILPTGMTKINSSQQYGCILVVNNEEQFDTSNFILEPYNCIYHIGTVGYIIWVPISICI